MTSSTPPPVAARVWLAENSASGSAHTRELLSLAGHQVETFADAAGLLARLEPPAAEAPDVLLLDWLLPDLPGAEVCRLLRARFSPTALPILVLTASTHEGDLEEVFGAGANDYLVKPARLVELRVRVRSLLQASQAAHRLREQERALAETEAARLRLASLFENAPALICALRGAELVYELSNPLHQRLVGVDRALVGRPLREAVPEAVDQGVVALLERVYRTGEPYFDRELALRIDRRGDGTLVEAFVNVVYQPARDAAGLVVGVDVFGYEVTEQVLARREMEALAPRLRQSEERLRQVVESSGTGTWAMDVPTGLVSSDARHRWLVGLPPGDTHALDTHFGSIHEEDQARMEGAISAALAGEGGGRFHIEFRIVGSGVMPERWVEGRGQAYFDAQGKPVRLVGTSVDATARKVSEAALRLSEAEFRTLAEASPDTVFTTTPEGVFTYVSPALLRYTGLALADFTGTGYRDIIHPDHRGPCLEAFARALRTGEPYTCEHPVRGADGGYRWHLVRALPVRDVEGRVVKWVGTSVDVHVLREAQEALAQRADFEEQLIGIVSHDLRNPIAAITMSAATLLRRPDFEERQRRTLMRILTSAERAHRMIRDLLDFTQARLGGGLPVVRTPGNVHTTVLQVMEEVEEAHPGRIVELEQSGSGQGLWDADRLAQVVGNLLSNALHYSPPGTPVRVTSRGEEGAVLLTVHNQGASIPPEVLPRLFQPMQRGEHAPAQGRSVGLGLYIVDQVVRAHGGTVHVASTAEAGTTFTVRLPRTGP